MSVTMTHAYTIMIEDETQATGWSDRFEGSEHNQFETRFDAETAAAELSAVYPSVRWAVFQDDSIEPVYIVNQGDDLVLVRSDQGDGGWSLHPAGSTDEQIRDGNVLVSGPAQWDDDEGDWDRPNAQDYEVVHNSRKERAHA